MKISWKKILLLPAAAVFLSSALILTGCSGSEEPSGGSDPAKEVSSIAIEGTASNLEIGATAELKVLAKYAEGEDEDVTKDAKITSSAPEVLSVEKNIITAKKEGSAEITVSYGGKEDKITISVTEKGKEPEKILSSIKLSVIPQSITVGASVKATVTAIYTDSQKYPDEDVTSSAKITADASYLEENGKGVFKGKNAGSAKIKAEYQDKTSETVVRIEAADSKIIIRIAKVQYKDAPCIWIWQDGKGGKDILGVKEFDRNNPVLKLKDDGKIWWKYEIERSKFDSSKGFSFKINDQEEYNHHTIETIWCSNGTCSNKEYNPNEKPTVKNVSAFTEPAQLRLGESAVVGMKIELSSGASVPVQITAVESKDKNIIIYDSEGKKKITVLNKCDAEVTVKGKYDNAEYSAKLKVKVDTFSSNQTIYVSKRTVNNAAECKIYIWQDGDDGNAIKNKISGDWNAESTKMTEHNKDWFKYEVKAGNYIPGKKFFFKLKYGNEESSDKEGLAGTFYLDKEQISEKTITIVADPKITDIKIVLETLSSGIKSEIIIQEKWNNTSGFAPVKKPSDVKLSSETPYNVHLFTENGKWYAMGLIAGNAKIKAEYAEKTDDKTLEVKATPVQSAVIYAKTNDTEAPEIAVWQIDGAKGVSDVHKRDNKSIKMKKVDGKSKWWQYEIAKTEYIAGLPFKFQLNRNSAKITGKAAGTIYYDFLLNKEVEKIAAEPVLKVNVDKTSAAVGSAIKLSATITEEGGSPKPATDAVFKLCDDKGTEYNDQNKTYLAKIAGDMFSALADGTVYVKASKDNLNSAHVKFTVTAPTGGKAKTIYVPKKEYKDSPLIWIWQKDGTECTAAMGKTFKKEKMISHNDTWWKYEIPNGKYVSGKKFTIQLFANEDDNPGHKKEIDFEGDAVWKEADEYKTSEPVIVVGLVFEPENVTVESGKEIAITVKKVDSKGNKTAVSNAKLTVKDTASAVIKDGKLRGLLAGSGKIVAEADGLSKEANLTVTQSTSAKDALVLHFKKTGDTAPTIYVWQDWDGVAIPCVEKANTREPVVQDTEAGWWKYEVKAHRYIAGKPFSFNLSGDGYNESDNKSAVKAGAFWYREGSFYDSKPADAKTPASLSITNTAVSVEAGKELALTAQVTYTSSGGTASVNAVYSVPENNGIAAIVGGKLKGLSIGKDGSNGKITVTAEYTENGTKVSSTKEFIVTAPSGGSEYIVHVRKYDAYDNAPTIWVWQPNGVNCSEFKGETGSSPTSMTEDSEKIWWEYKIPNGKYTPKETFKVKLNNNEYDVPKDSTGVWIVAKNNEAAKVLIAKPQAKSLTLKLKNEGGTADITELVVGAKGKVEAIATYGSGTDAFELYVTPYVTFSTTTTANIEFDGTGTNKNVFTAKAAIDSANITASYQKEGLTTAITKTATIKIIALTNEVQITLKSKKWILNDEAQLWACVFANDPSATGKWIKAKSASITSHDGDGTAEGVFIVPKNITKFLVVRCDKNTSESSPPNWTASSGAGKIYNKTSDINFEPNKAVYEFWDFITP